MTGRSLLSTTFRTSSAKSSKRLLLLGAVAASVALTGCASMHSPDAATGEQKVNSTTWGATLGALSGAAIGQMAGKDTKSTLIGAAVGGAVGAGIGYSMDKQEQELRQELLNSGVQVQRKGNHIVLLMRDQIAFESGKDYLQPRIIPALNSVGKVLKRYPKTNVQVLGFTDSTGSRSFNMLLSKSRAQSVANQLASRGVKHNRIVVEGHGPDYALCPNTTTEGRACNRRVEINLFERPTK